MKSAKEYNKKHCHVLSHIKVEIIPLFVLNLARLIKTKSHLGLRLKLNKLFI